MKSLLKKVVGDSRMMCTVLAQERKADLTLRSDGKQTPMHVAASHGATNVAELLLKVVISCAARRENNVGQRCVVRSTIRTRVGRAASIIHAPHDCMYLSIALGFLLRPNVILDKRPAKTKNASTLRRSKAKPSSSTVSHHAPLRWF